ncbi:pseudouridine-5'-phosphate glycosidase, partial [Streptomyces albidoflavus]|uniref:pseudouridine-5'-phosphate glycosidase n=1 Tax=Streptomyces albidoflavus TaxID=1886 RepID=UPI003D098ADB
LTQPPPTKVALVCAGAQKILDRKLTMESLETQCVPVISTGSDDFPAFSCASTGVRRRSQASVSLRSPPQRVWKVPGRSVRW